MQEYFDDEPVAPVAPRRDTELTLGPLLLMGLFLALAVLCGGSFGLGYFVGHRGLKAVAQPVPVQAATQPASGPPKPSAAPQPVPAAPQTAAAPSETDASTGNSTSGESSAATPSADGSLKTQPAPALSILVEIEGISSPEDASVLAAALRKRSYPVKEQHADGRVHVQVGPFASRDEAEKWRGKLLNDGYDAKILP